MGPAFDAGNQTRFLCSSQSLKPLVLSILPKTTPPAHDLSPVISIQKGEKSMVTIVHFQDDEKREECRVENLIK
jgi:hypothetical protein